MSVCVCVRWLQLIMSCEWQLCMCVSLSGGHACVLPAQLDSDQARGQCHGGIEEVTHILISRVARVARVVCSCFPVITVDVSCFVLYMLAL